MAPARRAKVSTSDDEEAMEEAPGDTTRKRRSFVPRLAIAVLAGSILYWTAADAPLPFVASWWEAGGKDWAEPLHRRQRIADWLILSHRLIGNSRATVVGLLGEPPPTEYFKQWDMVYWLGPERSFISIDSEWLVLRLNDQGIVLQAEIVGD